MLQAQGLRKSSPTRLTLKRNYIKSDAPGLTQFTANTQFGEREMMEFRDVEQGQRRTLEASVALTCTHQDVPGRSASSIGAKRYYVVVATMSTSNEGLSRLAECRNGLHSICMTQNVTRYDGTQNVHLVMNYKVWWNTTLPSQSLLWGPMVHPGSGSSHTGLYGAHAREPSAGFSIDEPAPGLL